MFMFMSIGRGDEGSLIPRELKMDKQESPSYIALSLYNQINRIKK